MLKPFINTVGPPYVLRIGFKPLAERGVHSKTVKVILMEVCNFPLVFTTGSQERLDLKKV